ncbi:cytochrome B [Rhodoferax lacus]|uniref:Cytochrome B n=1 Tax=Rhodoferax lacus TaxID=2184758 RepID=A0A3E1R8D3_9BURK|nr:cytochrome b [Rhodoferax lacus]RFO95629.1 cytochrome B [Rhodoferax lacus]
MPTTPSSVQRYSQASIAMHWLMVLAFIGIYAAINLTEIFPEGDAGNAGRQWAMDTHFSLGLLVFGLVWLRLLFRLMGTTPAILPAPPVWQEKLAKLMHLALYAMMVLMPVVGLVAVNTHGHSVTFFGLAVPRLLEESERWSHTIMRVHELGGNVGYFLIGAHAVAGLFHHYVVKDNTLRRMWLK